MSDPKKPEEATHTTSAASQPVSPSPDTAEHEQGMSDAPADPAALEARIRELESQQADLTDRLLRAHADMDNLRKRTERERIDAGKYAITKFANDVVGVVDNFQRAVSSVPPAAIEQDATLNGVVEGVLMTERAFLQVLERHGVKRIDPSGQPFNPNLHQAVMEQESVEVPTGTVLQVYQLGYMIEDRVLRPAMVVVSRGGAKAPRPAASDPAAPEADNARNADGGAAA